MSKSASLSIDFETASLADLRRTGAHPYARHPSTRVLCMSYAFGDQPIRNWREGQPFPQDVLDHVLNARRVDAWNAAFEFEIWNNTLLRQIGADADVHALSAHQLYDTMAAAAYWGLPLSLDQAAPAAGLSVTKDKEGHRLMMQMCKPRKHDTKTGVTTWWHEDDPSKFSRLVQYCDSDVATERAIKDCTPDLPPQERAMWLLDHKINQRGVTVDVPAVERLKALSADALAQVNAELQTVTSGAVKTVNATASLLRWLSDRGYPEDNLRKGTVADRLTDPDCIGTERAALTLRADGAKTSAAKLNAMLDATPVRNALGTIHGMLQYYGASRTGRWAGRLVQLQNMPRPTIKKPQLAIAMAMAGADADTIAALFGPAMGVIASCLRGCIVAPEGHELVVPDFSQIEARVLPWLAGQQDVLDVFRSGRDVYKQAAAGIYGAPEDRVTSDQRQIGKVAILALGFGGGKGAFLTMAGNYGLSLPEDEAEQIKTAWRQANPETVSFWWELDRAARTVIADPKQIAEVGHLRLGMWGPHMVIRLPSGRALVYRDARVQNNPDRPGTTEITYMGINQYTRKWERIRTYGGKLAENVTQAVARDVMAVAMVKADAAGHKIILTVHDELLTVAPLGQGAKKLDELIQIMRTPPDWAPGLPTDGDGWHGHRYRK